MSSHISCITQTHKIIISFSLSPPLPFSIFVKIPLDISPPPLFSDCVSLPKSRTLSLSFSQSQSHESLILFPSFCLSSVTSTPFPSPFVPPSPLSSKDTPPLFYCFFFFFLVSFHLFLSQPPSALPSLSHVVLHPLCLILSVSPVLLDKLILCLYCISKFRIALFKQNPLQKGKHLMKHWSCSHESIWLVSIFFLFI